MSNSKKMTVEEVRLEANKLHKQMDDLIENYCLSISPYKIGDKVLNPDGKLAIINKIRVNPSFFYESMKQVYQPSTYYLNYLDNCPFYYCVQELRKKDGKPMVHGIRRIYMYLDEFTGELNMKPF